jgi:hypothetical protein
MQFEIFGRLDRIGQSMSLIIEPGRWRLYTKFSATAL